MGKATPPSATAKGYTVVEAYACDQCLRPHTTGAAARLCCQCDVCHVKFPHHNNYGSICGHCGYGSQLREARARVRREEESLFNAQVHLAKLLTEKRPPEGDRGMTRSEIKIRALRLKVRRCRNISADTERRDVIAKQRLIDAEDALAEALAKDAKDTAP